MSLTGKAIHDTYAKDAKRGHNWRLSGGNLGEECERSLWFGFRWSTAPEVLDGRKLRLFDTGHREEARVGADLRRAGIHFLALDPETGKQFTYLAHGGHFKSKFDGAGLNFPEAPNTWHLVEIKTHNLKSFKLLLKKRVREAKPLHWVQMQIYMHQAGLERAMYIAVCKDNDEIHTERVEYDFEEATKLMAKAGRIIFAPRPASKISDDPKFFGCMFCSAKPICHGDDMPESNCRTCMYSTPEPDGDTRWTCGIDPSNPVDLDIDSQKAGCSRHLFHPDTINADQVDAGDGWVLYRRRIGDRAGEEFVDGVRE
jgi:hypothetical protein